MWRYFCNGLNMVFFSAELAYRTRRKCSAARKHTGTADIFLRAVTSTDREAPLEIRNIKRSRTIASSVRSADNREQGCVGGTRHGSTIAQ
jgi:hypothetical protein